MILSALILLSSQAPEPPRLVFLGAGRFAQYADLSTLTPDGPGGRIRTFQVVEPDFRAAGQGYWGGWSWWAFDCDASTVDRLDFAAVREGGAEGPATPDDAPAYEAAPGGDAAELLYIACDPEAVDPDAYSLEAAVEHGRANLAAGD